MEIDDLKIIWKNGEGFTPKNETEIASMLKKSSNSIINKLKRSVWLEMLFTLVSGTLLLFYALTLSNGALKWTSVSILILFFAASVYYIKKLMLLRSFDPGKDNIKASLLSLTANLTSYLKFYRRSYTILYPIFFVLSLIFIAIEQGADGFMNTVTKPTTIIYLIILAGIFYFCSTWLVNWFLKKMYGNHIEKLKGLLNDLES